ncbi:MAG: hypothetical protein V4615_03190 [Bacteroidota bacterium]
MKRKAFIKNAALTAAGGMMMPYILPTGRLFAATGSRKVDHVVFCLFAGGVRNLESMQMAEGNVMPNTLIGNQSISSDIAGSMTALPAPASQKLQSIGTLFKNFRYADGPTGHYNGHITAITGKYSDEAVQLKQPPKYPTIFEYYRKHNSPSQSALNSWWVCDSLGPYPYLNYSLYDGYGPLYGANTIQPGSIFSYNSNSVLGNTHSFTNTEKAKCDLMKEFMNGQFRSSTQLVTNGIKNTPQDAETLQAFIKQMMLDLPTLIGSNPWGLPAIESMNNDMFNIFTGIKIIEQFKPELMVINLQGIDIGHFNFTDYVDNMRKADFALRKLWDTIQSTPGMQNNTVLIVAPEHGRNRESNTVADTNGRYALDHTAPPPTSDPNADQMAREIFCLIAGPSGKVRQNQVITNQIGQSVDILPTIANVLGFGSSIDVALDGRVLTEAFY